MNDKANVLKKLQISDLCNNPRKGSLDLQGWNSQNKLLLDRVTAAADPLIIEVGVWKGGSSIAMAQQLANRNAKGTIISIDTFLGSSEHYLQTQTRDAVGISPKDEILLLQIFLDNIASTKMANWIIPLALDSQSAFELVNSREIEADIIHIDAGHHYLSVYLDLVSWWNVLKPGGYMVCDDYNSGWPAVIRAVDDFLKTVEHDNFTTDHIKCAFRKTKDENHLVPEIDINSLVKSHDDAEVEMYRSSIVRLNAALRQMEGSLSWKITGPLRTLPIRIRRLYFATGNLWHNLKHLTITQTKHWKIWRGE